MRKQQTVSTRPDTFVWSNTQVAWWRRGVEGDVPDGHTSNRSSAGLWPRGRAEELVADNGDGGLVLQAVHA